MVAKRAAVAQLVVDPERQTRRLFIHRIETKDLRYEVESCARPCFGQAAFGRIGRCRERPCGLLRSFHTQPVIEFRIEPVEVGQQAGFAALQQSQQPWPVASRTRGPDEIDIGDEVLRADRHIVATRHEDRRVLARKMLELENRLAEAGASLRLAAIAP